MSYGWFIVILLFVTNFFNAATVWYGFTAYFDPLIKEFAWSYTAISVAAAIRGVESGVLDIFVGLLVDRIGPRRILFFAAVMVSGGFFILSHLEQLSVFYMAYVIISVGATGLGSIISTALVARWFKKRLGLVLAITSSGFGAGGIALPFIVYLLNIIDFRDVFLIFSVIALLMAIILIVFVRNRPEDRGYLADGVLPGATADTSAPTAVSTPIQIDVTIRKALTTVPFWMIFYVMFSSFMLYSTVITHIMPYLETSGYTRYAASTAAMAIPILSIFGRMATGYFSGRVRHKRMAQLSIVAILIGTICFMFVRFEAFLILFLLLVSTGFGAMLILRPLILKDHFGIGNIGSILGVNMGFSCVGSVCGPLLAGWIFDTTGSYTTAWIILGIILAFNIPIISLIKDPARI